MCQEGTEVTWLLSPSISTQQFCLTVSSISPAAGLVLTSFPGNPPLSWESFPLHSLVFASLLSLGRIQEGRCRQSAQRWRKLAPRQRVCRRSPGRRVCASQKQCRSEMLFLSSVPRTNAKPRAAAGYTSRIWQHRAFERRSLV